MENKISAIDEKLAELKLSKESPNIEALFAQFGWTREWFAQAEEVLLDLAFRGESDAVVIEFIRKKIVDTDIITFNKILRSFSAEPIHNHYELIAKSTTSAKRLFIESGNSKVMEAMFKEYLNPYILSGFKGSKLSVCTNDVAVEYLIKHPDKINWEEFVCNTNIKAMKYCMEKRQIDLYVLSSADDDEIVRYLFANPELIYYEALSQNPNNLAVDHLLANPQNINITALHLNTNPRAVEYLLTLSDHIEWEELVGNSNDKAVEYLLTNKNGNDLRLLSENTNDKAVEFLISNPKFINWEVFYSNPNDKATEYSLMGIKPKQHQYMYTNYCNYNMQKLREFNKLVMFPRIQYIEI